MNDYTVTTTRVEVELSMRWISNNPMLAVDRAAQFVKDYPTAEWNHMTTDRGHAVVFIASRKEPKVEPDLWGFDQPTTPHEDEQQGYALPKSYQEALETQVLTLPMGYSTIIGWSFDQQARLDVRRLDALLSDLLGSTQRDAWALVHETPRKGYEVIKVMAPEVLRRMGIETVNAYPNHLIQARMKEKGFLLW